ncbi:hypothetical protein [Tabrizicola sp.]|uniref:hypothetical protein n=1 Tax=Tabrizicola sp. TaxID=2005166 RepID=UPI002620C8C6|nr:hypothetical protein [Tabrizicola sp.]MDM7931576.1 hypothetical protein [Tabrizicola sp.]
MIEEDGELTVAERLGRLLDRGLLPAGGPAEAAERLIERLERPARVALLGLPGAGKSSVLNLLAGTVVVPETLRLPTMVVQHGSEARMLCTLADGRVEDVPGTNLEQALRLNPALVTVEMDLPSLKVISLLEVAAGPMETEQRRAAVWASKRADILIWCTTSFLPKEQMVWESMPDSVKDNGFLFLTKVDLLGSPEAAQGMLERVEQRAGEDFRQVLSISTKQARAAMPPGGPIDRNLFRDSGAAAVITTIKARVQMAQRADTDMAELLLARHVEAGGIVARRFADPDPAAATEAVAGQADASTEPATPPASTEPEKVPEPEQVFRLELVAKPEPAPEPALVEDPAPEPDQVAGLLSALRLEPELEAAVEPQQESAAEGVAEIAEGPDSQPEPEIEPEPEDQDDLPADAASNEPMDAEPLSAAGAKRFSDRIRQAAPATDAGAAPPVPLRTTWKSRNEPAETSAAAPKPTLTPRKDIPKTPPPPRGKVLETPARPADTSTDAGPDDAAIAAMLAAAAAPPREPRTPRDRQSQSASTAPVGPAASDRAQRTRLFGARKPAAPELEPPELAPAEIAPAAEAPVEPVQPQDEAVDLAEAPAPAATPVEQLTDLPEDQPTAPSAPPAVPETRRFVAARAAGAEDMPSPRVAVLRERRADAPTAERRERPRIAARVVAAAPAPEAGPRAVPASEHGILNQAVALIISRAADLERLVDPTEKPPVDLILDHGRETTEQVIEVLSQASSAELRRINHDLSEVQDLIMLMQLEKGHAPADDAMTLILQIRRDLETLRAA